MSEKKDTHTIKFEFDCLHKDGAISMKTGEYEITAIGYTDEQIKTDRTMRTLIKLDMEQKTKKKVIDVRITEIINL